MSERKLVHNLMMYRFAVQVQVPCNFRASELRNLATMNRIQKETKHLNNDILSPHGQMKNSTQIRTLAEGKQ